MHAGRLQHPVQHRDILTSTHQQARLKKRCELLFRSMMTCLTPPVRSRSRPGDRWARSFPSWRDGVCGLVLSSRKSARTRCRGSRSRRKLARSLPTRCEPPWMTRLDPSSRRQRAAGLGLAKPRSPQPGASLVREPTQGGLGYLFRFGDWLRKNLGECEGRRGSENPGRGDRDAATARGHRGASILEGRCFDRLTTS